MVEEKIKNNSSSGVTLIALAITIIVLLIIAGVSVTIGMSSSKQAKENKLITELGMINHAVLERYTKAKLTKEEYPGVKVSETGIDIDAVISDISSQSGQSITKKDTNKDNYYYLSNSNNGLRDLGIKDAEDEYIVNYETGEVINYTTRVTNTNKPLYIYSKNNND